MPDEPHDRRLDLDRHRGGNARLLETLVLRCELASLVMRLLFLGDIVGRPGPHAVTERLPAPARALAARLRRHQRRERGRRLRHHRGDLRRDPDGRAPTPSRSATTPGTSARRSSSSSASRGSSGRRTIPPGTPGRGATVVEARNGARVLVVNVMGRLFMDALDDPFAAGRARARRLPARRGRRRHHRRRPRRGDEREAGAWPITSTGASSLVVGTHTHVPTADHRILPGGTAYMSDAGMCGDYEFGARHAERRSRCAASCRRRRAPRLEAAERRGHALRPRGRDRRPHRARGAASRRAARAGDRGEPGRPSGISPQPPRKRAQRPSRLTTFLFVLVCRCPVHPRGAHREAS